MHARAVDLAGRYVRWVQRRSTAIIVTHVVLACVAAYLAVFHLPLRADFANLLPQDSLAVRDLHKLEARVKATDTVLVIVRAPTSAERAASVDELAAALRRVPSSLVELVTTNHDDVRAYLETNGYLLTSLDELVRARDTLIRHRDQAVLEDNPLFVQLDDEPAGSAATADHDDLDALVAQHREARAKLARLSNVSADGTIAMIELRTAFRASDAGRGKQLLSLIDEIRGRVIAAHPGVEIGVTGGVVTAVVEHRAIVHGMTWSGVITGALVVLVLALYFRNVRLLGQVLVSLLVATVMAFGVSALTVGHLNAATAFLGAIIAGNGVNFGILLIGRYADERCARDPDDALVVAIAATLRPTLIAALGAAIAYGALAATSFKGFSDFAVIGAVGMLLVWIVTYVLLPALVLRAGARVPSRTPAPLVGRVIAGVFGAPRPRTVAAFTIVAGAMAAMVVARYVAYGPFEYNLKRLRSEGDDALLARRWMALSNRTFGSGVAGRTVIAADRPDQVSMIVDSLRAIDAGRAPAEQTIGDIWSLATFVPADQPRKLAILDEIRALIDRSSDAASDDQRRALAELRPPDALRMMTLAALPASLRERFTERDGRVGTLIEIRPSPQLDEWNGHDLIRFASAVREVRLRDGEHVTTSGTSVIFADIVASIERDGPFVTLLASAGLIVMVVLLVGFRRRAVAVIVSAAVGALFMVAGCALLGVRVTFLDFIALPITLGIGVDYAINLADPLDATDGDVRHVMRTSGASVLVCSLTTIIGYASLLVSDNLAIRGFGTASLIGEVACVCSALLLVPAFLRGSRSRTSTVSATA